MTSAAESFMKKIDIWILKQCHNSISKTYPWVNLRCRKAGAAELMVRHRAAILRYNDVLTSDQVCKRSTDGNFGCSERSINKGALCTQNYYRCVNMVIIFWGIYLIIAFLWIHPIKSHNKGKFWNKSKIWPENSMTFMVTSSSGMPLPSSTVISCKPPPSPLNLVTSFVNGPSIV